MAVAKALTQIWLQADNRRSYIYMYISIFQISSIYIHILCVYIYINTHIPVFVTLAKALTKSWLKADSRRSLGSNALRCKLFVDFEAGGWYHMFVFAFTVCAVSISHKMPDRAC